VFGALSRCHVIRCLSSMRAFHFHSSSRKLRQGSFTCQRTSRPPSRLFWGSPSSGRCFLRTHSDLQKVPSLLTHVLMCKYARHSRYPKHEAESADGCR
jgi:hypothetical protein